MTTMSRNTVRRGRRRALSAIALAMIVAAALIVPACSLNPAPKGYDLKATFSRAIGVYPHSPVRIQGIDVGEITGIKTTGDQVRLTMRIKSGHKVPKDATAALVPASLLGERYVQLDPVYTKGPILHDGDTITKTSIPYEFDQLLRSLENFTGAINPQSARDLISNLSALLATQGQSLNDLIDSGAGTLKLLANKSGELGDIIDALSTLTTALQGHTVEIQKLIADYNTLSGIVADNSGNLNQTITSLDALAREVAGLLQSHASQLPFDVQQLTHVTRTLDRNFDSLQTTFSSTVRLFDAAGRAYDIQHNALALNSQASPDYTSGIIASRLRDRFAGICRRLGGVTAVACGNQNSQTNPFNLLLPLIPGLISQIPGVNGQNPPAQKAPAPAAAKAPAAAPTATDPLQALRALNLTPQQLAALDNLSTTVMPLLQGLNEDQLAALASLTPEQMAGLRKLPLAQVPAALTAIRAGQLNPDNLLALAMPTLPGNSSAPALNGLVNSVLNGLATLGGH